jgi:hypothetical protein
VSTPYLTTEQSYKTLVNATNNGYILHIFHVKLVLVSHVAFEVVDRAIDPYALPKLDWLPRYEDGQWLK